MKTEVVAARAATERAVELLRRGEVVALPTETVYGLAGDALRPKAVLRIFESKERPRFNPLIVHLPDSSWLEKVADIPTQEKEIVGRLTNAFWPGPFTLVLPKTALIPDLVTAGLDTVAVRVSADPVFQKVIRSFGGPLAAPSANRFGRISPSIAEHVLSELDGRIPLIVDGGPTTHGIESTVVAIHDGEVEILRPGPISEENLRGIGYRPKAHRPADGATVPRSPGQLPSHYAPATRFCLIEHAASFAPPANQRVGLLAWHPVAEPARFAVVRQLSDHEDLREAAAILFRYLRELDGADLDLIVAERVPNEGLGLAINDRLQRAAGTGSSSRDRGTIGD